MKRIVLGIQYHGSPWRGWQAQPHGQTVQDQLQAALLSFTQETTTATCAGRTDAGVHAIEQVAHFDTEKERSMVAWQRGLNAYLPRSIAVRWAHEVTGKTVDGQEFHSRYRATERSYQYLLYNHPTRSPLLAQRAGWVFRPLNVEDMQAAANTLLGEHDFSAFRAAECQAKSPIKTLHQIEIRKSGAYLLFHLRANAFLHHMVRNLVGSLVFVGTGRRPASWMRELLDARDRSLAAPTFMPDGLYLSRIQYDPAWGLPHESGDRLGSLLLGEP